MIRPNRLRLAVFALGCAAVLLPQVASAQSLADVARQEEARRKEQAKAAKVYTNVDLTRDYTAPTPSDTGATAPVDQTSSADETDASTPPEPSRDQAYWSDRMSAARSQLDRSKTFAAALQTRLNSLSADFVNRDDPAQRAVIGQERLKTIAELERLQREVAEQTKAITAIEEEARKARVPPGWLR